jgi:hypothetical protein
MLLFHSCQRTFTARHSHSQEVSSDKCLAGGPSNEPIHRTSPIEGGKSTLVRREIDKE